MAILEHQSNKEKVILRALHIFGRRKSRVDTLLPDDDVSQVHASIRWEGNRWKIIDHSRNGTWVDGNRLAAGTSFELHMGQQLGFGCVEKPKWIVTDLRPPRPVLLPQVEGPALLELETVHGLPDDDNPEAMVYQNENGLWVCEYQNEITVLNESDIVHICDTPWQFIPAGSVDATLDNIGFGGAGLENFVFKFYVSLDEEHVRLSISQNEESIDLGERVHHYLLLTLARHRLADANRGVDKNNQGWMDMQELSKMLGLDNAYLNIQIFRARKQIGEALYGVLHLPQVVERRIGSIRFGFPEFQITRGASMQEYFQSEQPCPDTVE